MRDRAEIMYILQKYAEDPRLGPNPLTRRELAVVGRVIFAYGEYLSHKQRFDALKMVDDWLEHQDSRKRWDDGQQEST